MYCSEIIERRLRRAVQSGMKYKRLPREDSIEIAAKLEKLRLGRDGRLLPNGQLIRQLDKHEEAFIESERLISKCDFEYWFTRYYKLELDAGVVAGGVLESPIGPPILLESQRRYLTLLGRREKECFEELKAYGRTLGILAYFHKVRQVTATATMRAISIHRMLFWSARCLASSTDDKRIGELFTRDHIAIDNLPWWQKPDIYPDVKDTEIGFPAPINSRISYQAENSDTGIGTGSQVDVSHFTEVALWKYPGRIGFSFAPAMPKAVTTLHVQESTANGKGDYWHEVTENARNKRRGYESWIYAFIPWYMNRMKYVDTPPANWTPEEHTQRHADLIERTSPEFFDGRTVRATREQLYWWETARALHSRRGELATFLTNYPATPEQSFQSPNGGALPVELIEIMEQECKEPMVYEVEVAR